MVGDVAQAIVSYRLLVVKRSHSAPGCTIPKTMLTKNSIWAKAAMADTIADMMTTEVRLLGSKKPSPFSKEIQDLIRNAYQHATSLSASLNRLEALLGG